MALVIVAAGAAVWGLVAMVSANGELDTASRAKAETDAHLAELRSDDDLAFARARAEVIDAARHAVPVLHTLDHRNLDEGLAAWAEVTTGSLHDEVSNVSEEQRKALRDAQASTTAEVLSAAVKELDDRAGTATVITALKKTQTNAQDSYLRVEAELSRTDQGWKLSALGMVPYLEPGS